VSLILLSSFDVANVVVNADTAFIQIQSQAISALVTQSDLGMTFTLTPADDTIAVSQGADEVYQIAAFDSSKQPVDLTGAKGFFTVKKQWRDATAVILKRTSNAGGDDSQFIVLPQIGATKGLARFFVAAADTESFSADEVDNANNYVYDIWLVLASGKHKTVRQIRRFEILQSVSTIL
jgi:hypothetical protein